MLSIGCSSEGEKGETAMWWWWSSREKCTHAMTGTYTQWGAHFSEHSGWGLVPWNVTLTIDWGHWGPPGVLITCRQAAYCTQNDFAALLWWRFDFTLVLSLNPDSSPSFWLGNHWNLKQGYIGIAPNMRGQVWEPAPIWQDLVKAEPRPEHHEAWSCSEL